MSDEDARDCTECEGSMFPVVMMDKMHGGIGQLEYRLPDDKRSFWTGRYPTAGLVQAFLCQDCGRIALYGQVSNPPSE